MVSKFQKRANYQKKIKPDGRIQKDTKYCIKKSSVKTTSIIAKSIKQIENSKGVNKQIN